MIYFKLYIKQVLALSLLMLMSCVEEFLPETITFEDLLVVEATLTDELKYHEVKLSRTFRFEDEPVVESDAEVRVMDDSQNVYVFNETGQGHYVSTSKFSAQPDKNYTLHISTKNNETYSSSAVKSPSNTAQITDVSYVNSVSSNGEEGIDILVDSFDPFGNSKYYRYEFVETQRIVAPFWGALEIVIISDTPPFKVDAIPRTEEKRTCYKTTISNGEIVQTQTNSLSEDRVTKFPVKFISKKDSIIRDRYSVLVKQHVQNLEAYTYYQKLNEFSISENVFSENQPGFLEGNIFSNANPDEKVLGFFEINSVSSKRLFLSYEDAFPNENRIPYFSSCSKSKPYLTDPDSPNRSPLIELVKNGEVVYLQTNQDFFGNPIENPPFEVVTRACGDCTFYGSNIKPEFWID